MSSSHCYRRICVTSLKKQRDCSRSEPIHRHARPRTALLDSKSVTNVLDDSKKWVHPQRRFLQELEKRLGLQIKPQKKPIGGHVHSLSLFHVLFEIFVPIDYPIWSNSISNENFRRFFSNSIESTWVRFWCANMTPNSSPNYPWIFTIPSFLIHLLGGELNQGCGSHSCDKRHWKHKPCLKAFWSISIQMKGSIKFAEIFSGQSFMANIPRTFRLFRTETIV